MDKEITIIIPAYNEESAIGSVIDDLKNNLPGIDLLVIDDGSTDKTAKKVSELGVRLIQHEHNMGYGAAIKTGIRNVNTSFVALFDADGQHQANDLAPMIESMRMVDMVIGARDARSDRSLMRTPGKLILQWVANTLCSRIIPDLNSGLRIMRREIINRYIHLMPNGFSFSTTSTIAFHHEGYLVKYTPIVARKRLGQSSVNIVSDGIRVLLLIIRMVSIFSPLRLFIPVSLVLFILTLISLWSNIDSGGNLTDATILFGLSTLITFLMGLMADQLSNIRREIGG